MMKGDVLATAKALAKDPSPQVRREVALALYGHASDEAAAIWTTLAQQYDGKDRWYLEALGIGASLNWDKYFATWRKTVGKDWDTTSGRDIVWRSRASAAMPLLAELVQKGNETEMLRYYRAFDFHKDASKQQVLASLVQKTKGRRVLLALKHMDPTKLKMTPALSTALNKALDEYKGSLEFVELVSLFNLKDRSKDLLSMSIQYPDSVKGKEAMKSLVEWEQNELILSALDKSNDDAQAAIKTIWPHMRNKNARDLMVKVMMDSSRNIEIRKLAVKTFGGPWESEDHLLAMARDKQIPADLQTAAAGVFQTAWRGTIREEAAKFITLPGSKGAASLPSVAVLAGKTGDASKGKEVFKTVCATCHQVKKEGVNFGPDLSEIGAKLSKEGLYTAILFPDQGISFGYEAWRIKLKDGSTAFGRIVSETEDKLDMQYMQQQQTVQKPEIESRVKLENSLMPSNLQSSMTEAELVDLVDYLGELR
jgi:putative heme-binding domain-containing protein